MPSWGGCSTSLAGAGLLADTDVIVTSDHGEAFGDHGLVGHSYSVNLDEVWVPLLILSAEAPGGRVIDEPVSLRDLPATVADRLGLAEDAPFPGRSLASFWASGTSTAPAPSTSPALSERLERTSTRPGPGPGGEPPAFEMSVVADGHHYIREGSGVERLYNLKTDPYEYMDVRERPEFAEEVKPFRRRLLEILESARGTDTVERGYLQRYRRSLRALVDQDEEQRVADAHDRRPAP